MSDTSPQTRAFIRNPKPSPANGAVASALRWRDENRFGIQTTQQGGQLVTKLPPGAPPPMPAVVKFHVAVSNQDIGETELEAIKKLAAEGKVNRTTLVWRDGMASWQAAESQVELKGLFQISPPPLAPTA
jgi:hypothetical protein